MRRTTRTRLGAALAACLAAHAGLLALLAREHPVLKTRALGPAVFDVTIVPMFVPAPPPPRKPAPRLHVRQARTPEAPGAPPPLLAPEFAPAPAAPPGPPPHLTPELGATLRRALGCANIASANLTQAEHDACLARLGAGAKSAPYLPPGFSREKQQALDAAGAAKEAYRQYRERPAVTGRSTKCDFGCSPHDMTGEDPPNPPKHPF